MAETLQDVILLRTCPSCKEQHFYAVKIQRAPFLGSSQLPVRPIRFTRLFTCPKNDVDFRVDFHLIQPSSMTYHKMQTLGAVVGPDNTHDLPLSTRYFDEARLTDYLRSNGISNSALLVPPGGLRYGSFNIICVIQ